MSSLITLRGAQESDLDAVMLLESSTFAGDAWPREMMRAELANPHGHYLVAEMMHASLVVGYAGLLCPRDSGDGDIQTIAVSHEMRGQGVGRSLLVALISEARDRGATRIFLEVRADNDPAQALYRNLGFIPIGVRKGYYQPDGVDAVSMRLDLGVSARPGSRSPGEEMEGAC